MTQPKIRPQQSTNPSPSPLERQHGSGGFRAPDELPERASAPDIGGRLVGDEAAVDASVAGAAAFVPLQAPGFGGLPPADLTLDPGRAAVERMANAERQNRLGNPRGQNEAEKLLAEYQRVTAAHKARYQGTRDNSLEPEWLAIREKCIDAGLI